jgi:hypothetical protein
MELFSLLMEAFVLIWRLFCYKTGNAGQERLRLSDFTCLITLQHRGFSCACRVMMMMMMMMFCL